MSHKQLDVVEDQLLSEREHEVNADLRQIQDQLLSEDNAELSHAIYCAYLEDAERGANMIITFAREKGLKLNASTEDVVQAMKHSHENASKIIDEEDMDIEMTEQELAIVSGGASLAGVAAYYAASALFGTSAVKSAMATAQTAALGLAAFMYVGTKVAKYMEG